VGLYERIFAEKLNRRGLIMTTVSKSLVTLYAKICSHRTNNQPEKWWNVLAASFLSSTYQILRA